MKSRVCVVFLLLVGSVTAQPSAVTIIHRVRVHVVFVNGACDLATHVRLVGLSGPVFEGVANDQCEVEFFNLPEGNYHLTVSGDRVTPAESGDINVTFGGPDEFEVPVKRPKDLYRNDGIFGNSLVSASDLSIPNRARQEFDKANEWIGKQEWAQAIHELNKAISIYPSYAVAYNNLGVIYSRMGDPRRELAALQKAISLNGHFALAYVNLGRMNITAGNFPAAETALDKASSFDPTDPMALVLLCYAEFMDHRFDEAIATSRKAHALDKSHAFVHRVAARAFEQKRQGASAIAELELFLKEEPSGPRAEAARKELQIVEAVLRPD
jgi:Flp pilus assembly protein TadD